MLGIRVEMAMLQTDAGVGCLLQNTDEAVWKCNPCGPAGKTCRRPSVASDEGIRLVLRWERLSAGLGGRFEFPVDGY
jgi:hypothetical protein